MASTMMVPCFELTNQCNLDWAAVAALGGWAAAIGTVVAVIVALLASKAQVAAAEKAVRAEREKSEHIQQREWDQGAKADKRAAKHLAIALSKELFYARRSLVVKMLDWDPDQFSRASPAIVDSYFSNDPFPDLVYLRASSHRLQGFKDGAASALLSVLTAWQFYNRSPGLNFEEFGHKPESERRRFLQARAKFGFDLLDLIEGTIGKLEGYYKDDATSHGVELGELSPGTAEAIENLRSRVRR